LQCSDNANKIENRLKKLAKYISGLQLWSSLIPRLFLGLILGIEAGLTGFDILYIKLYI